MRWRSGGTARDAGPLVIILVAFLTLAIGYSVIIPLWEAPDEPEHMQYVVYLIQHHALPTQLPTIQTDGNNEGKQPPLYYLLALPFVAGVDLGDAVRIRINPHAGWAGMPDGTAAATHVLDEGWPYHGVFLAAHRLRVFSALLGGLTVLLTYGIATAASGSRNTGLLAAGLMAFLPGFLFTSSTIDNDALADTLAAALVFVAFRTTPLIARRHALLFGLLSGMVILTKLTALPAIGVGGIVLFRRAGKPERRSRLPLVVALPVLPSLLYWSWRIANGERRLIGRPPAWPPPGLGGTGPLDWSAPLLFARHFWTSFFGVFSWGSILLPFPLYLLYGVLFATGLLFAILRVRGWGRWAGPLQGSTALFPWPVLQLASMVGANLLVSQTRVGMDHARLFYPALPAVVTLAACGWSRVVDLQRRLATFAPVLLGLAILAAAIPLLVVRPVYAPPWPVSNRLPVGATPLRVAGFVDTVTLAGVTLPAGPLGAGQGIYVWFYWRVQHPVPDGSWLFVHVVNDHGNTAAAFDGVPSSATLPLRYWRAGDMVYEREVLTLHSDAQAGIYAVKVGWYNPKTGVRLPVAGGGTEVTVGTLQIAAATSRRSGGDY